MNMAKKQKHKEESTPKVKASPITISKMLPSEWARSKSKNEKFYFYHDKKLGVVTEEEFDNIEV